jgi:hypothetical protein
MDESEVDGKRQEAERLLAAGQYDDAKAVAEEIHAFAVESGDRDLREEMEYFVINAEEQQRKTALPLEEEVPSAPAEEEVPAPAGQEVSFNMETGEVSGKIGIGTAAAPSEEELPTVPEPYGKKGKKGKAAKPPKKEEVPPVEEGEIPWGQGIFRESYKWDQKGDEFALKKAWPALAPAEEHRKQRIETGKDPADIKVITVIRKNYAGQYCFNAKGESFAVYER